MMSSFPDRILLKYEQHLCLLQTSSKQCAKNLRGQTSAKKKRKSSNHFKLWRRTRNQNIYQNNSSRPRHKKCVPYKLKNEQNVYFIAFRIFIFRPHIL